MPSTDEAFGVAYVEAMAAGCPPSARAASPGRRRSRRAATACVLVPPGDPEALAGALTSCSPTRAAAPRSARRARATVERALHLGACGRATVAAYEDALR